ncbi:hypothetical protein RclHR1_07850007 [Rhizophagus clarus]|uniref:BTB/POZ protein n=1 Tax=Rhizophagus clarus TaxID=94130 RepID=A0A2Z6SA31_9GLOM|nr:hypothetical protein RclHR1_07850007 [Rhizophagus clarus]GES96392.1 BTB/POZ protein [Rhizophagus clarus]
MDDNKLLQKLSQNLLEILNDDEYYDVKIEVGDDPFVRIFRAHMVILSYRSTYLRRILSTNEKKDNETLVQIKLPNMVPEIFQIILRYIYGGKLSLEDYDTLVIVKILVAAEILNLHELIVYLQSFLVKNKSDWMEKNFNLIYQTSFENDSFSELQKYCTNLVSKDPDKIFKSLDLCSVPEKLLTSLIQNDNLQMSEVQIWKNVLKWGLAQNPGLSSNPSDYSRDDFNTLRNTLRQCIPFIRFYSLTSQDFLYSVIPYKDILPEELYMDLLKTFLDPNSKPSLFEKQNKYKRKERKKIEGLGEVKAINNSSAMPFDVSMLNALFIEDVNVPDGTTILPQTKFVKIWKMRNNGIINWPESTALHFIGGQHMFDNTLIKSSPTTPRSNISNEVNSSGEEENHCPRCKFSIRSNKTVCEMCGASITGRGPKKSYKFDKNPKFPVGSVEVGKDVCIAVNLQAPSEYGKYISFWRLTDSEGKRFGHKVWCDITVEDD